MSLHQNKKWLIASISSFFTLGITAGHAQEVLEPIIISAPSPIIKNTESLPGNLIFTDGTFVPVTVATQREILATQGGNIADILDEKPGIIGSTFTAGANRPIIRGLDNYRVRVQENGIGAHDVSALSEDHAVPIDPFAANQVEVIRGPATLRYGSSAIGGVVSVQNNRIPTAIPKNGISGEIKGGLSSVDKGKDGAISLTAGAGPIAIHADAFKRETKDYSTPKGDQFNTFSETDGFAFGGSLIGSDGFIGVSFSRYNSFYGIPGEEAAELLPRIDLTQDRIQVKGELRPKAYGVDAVRFWFGRSDYKHSEIVRHHEEHDEEEEEEHHEEVEDEVGSLFTRKVNELRVELQHTPFQTSILNLSGAIGLQYTNSKTEGESFEGDSLLKPAETDSIAAYIFEEMELSKNLTLQAASRIEHTQIKGFGREEPLHADDPLIAMSKSYTPISGSLGMLYRFDGGSVFSLSGQYVERAPADAELFSAGIHEATGTLEIGNPNLKKEKAFTLEAGLRKKKGPFRYDLSAYYTRFNGFIYKDLTGLHCGTTLESCEHEEEEEEGHEEEHAHELEQVLFGQRNANFFGLELAMQYDVASLGNGVWGVDGQFDLVKAKFDQGGNVPRIPPARLGGGIFYRDNNMFARLGVLHAFDQSDISEHEIKTPVYTLLSAEMSYTMKDLETFGQGSQFTIGVKGENLANDEVLNHTSFKRREEVYLPGASVKVFGSIKFN